MIKNDKNPTRDPAVTVALQRGEQATLSNVLIEKAREKGLGIECRKMSVSVWSSPGKDTYFAWTWRTDGSLPPMFTVSHRYTLPQIEESMLSLLRHK